MRDLPFFIRDDCLNFRVSIYQKMAIYVFVTLWDYSKKITKIYRTLEALPREGFLSSLGRTNEMRPSSFLLQMHYTQTPPKEAEPSFYSKILYNNPAFKCFYVQSIAQLNPLKKSTFLNWKHASQKISECAIVHSC